MVANPLACNGGLFLQRFQGIEGAASGPALHAYYVISGQGTRLRELVIEAVDPPAVVTDVRGERVVAAPVARREPVSTSRAE